MVNARSSGFNETRATNSHNNYRSAVNPSFVSPRRGKTSRHKADRFSRLIHLVEVNKHCVPYLLSAQLMRGTLCSLSRPSLFLHPLLLLRFSRTVLTISLFIALPPLRLSANLFHLLPPAPLVLSLTRYYLCRWASQFLYIICEEPSLEGRQNGLEWTGNGRSGGVSKRIWNFQDCGADAVQISIRTAVERENIEKTDD